MGLFQKDVLMQLIYHIEGMHCNSCVEKIKSALSSHFKIVDVTLNPPILKLEADQAPSLNDLNQYISVAGNYRLHHRTESSHSTNNDLETSISTYYPIFLIAIYIIGVATINNFHWKEINWTGWMNQFMAGFFLVFSAFKLLDIRGFAEGYSTYDLLAKRWYTYGYIYPFLELGLGILYLAQLLPTVTQIATVIIMGFSSIGVINSLHKKQKFQCACLGTILKVPLSSITLIEDLTMVVLAVLSLMMR
jgi:cation transport ATPase